MLFKEVVEIENKSRKKLENIVRGIYKAPNKSVPYNNVMEVINSIDDKGYWEGLGLKIVRIIKEVEFEYYCDDEEELKEMIDEYGDEIIKKDGLNLTVKSTVTVDYMLEGNPCVFDVVTAEEGARLVGVTEGAIRKAMASGRLKLGCDYRKSGRITLISKDSLLKAFKK